MHIWRGQLYPQDYDYLAETRTTSCGAYAEPNSLTNREGGRFL